jgi:hypothetical protein
MDYHRAGEPNGSIASVQAHGQIPSTLLIPLDIMTALIPKRTTLGLLKSCLEDIGVSNAQHRNMCSEDIHTQDKRAFRRNLKGSNHH